MLKWLFDSNVKHKTVLMFLVSTLSIIICLLVISYTSIQKLIQDDYVKTLKFKSGIVAQIYFDQVKNDHKGSDSAFREDNLIIVNENDFIFDVNKMSTSQIADSLDVPQFFIRSILSDGEATFQDDNLQYVGKYYKSELGDVIIITSAEHYFNKHIQNHLQKILIVCLSIVLIITVFISYYLSRSLFKPILKITKRVKEISSQSLHLRLEEEKYNKELNQLINTFNDMLNRIETSFESQNNFISNASHELRTPLTSIIGTAEVSLSKSRTSEEYVETLAVILKEAEKLDKKTKALLSLAQTGFNGKSQKLEPVRIDELLLECISTIKSIDGNCNILFDISLIPDNSSKLVVNGNEQLLYLAFTNIIMNGCKYSNHQTVKVSLGASNTKVVIIVQDPGIGIPVEEQEYIFDPFFRCSNTKKYEGYGIGLPLTRNILKMHSGKIIINSAINEGTIVEVHLPIKQF